MKWRFLHAVFSLRGKNTPVATHECLPRVAADNASLFVAKWEAAMLVCGRKERKEGRLKELWLERRTVERISETKRFYSD